MYPATGRGNSAISRHFKSWATVLPPSATAAIMNNASLNIGLCPFRLGLQIHLVVELSHLRHLFRRVAMLRSTQLARRDPEIFQGGMPEWCGEILDKGMVI